MVRFVSGVTTLSQGSGIIDPPRVARLPPALSVCPLARRFAATSLPASLPSRPEIPGHVAAMPRAAMLPSILCLVALLLLYCPCRAKGAKGLASHLSFLPSALITVQGSHATMLLCFCTLALVAMQLRRIAPRPRFAQCQEHSA